MKDQVRCKACGFILDKDALGDVCPACGVKRDFFEPWDDKLGATRRTVLGWHLHPIIVHIPNSLAPLLLLMAAVFPLVPPNFQSAILWPSLLLFTWLFPISVLGGYLSGLLDGKVRYKTLSAPLMVKKAVTGVLLLLSSVGQTVVVSVSDFGSGRGGAWVGYLLAALVSMACATALGHWGSQLSVGVMPGAKIFLGKRKKPAPKAST